MSSSPGPSKKRKSMKNRLFEPLKNLFKRSPKPGSSSATNESLPRSSTISQGSLPPASMTTQDPVLPSSTISHEPLPASDVILTQALLPPSSYAVHKSLPASSDTTNKSSTSDDQLGSQPRAEKLKIATRFARSILPKVAECVDGNPAQMAMKILKLIMDVRNEINESQDELQKTLEETLLLLSNVLAKMDTGSNPRSVVGQTVEQYKREVTEQLERITTINSLLHSSLFAQVDYENYKVQLVDISRKIGGATVRFNTAMAGTTGITVDEIRDTIRDEKQEKKLRDDLRPSEMAEHRFIHSGKSAVKRETCTEGTRVNILREIAEWANDSSVGSPPVFWMTGQAGAGKTTIAYTIAKRFEDAEEPQTTVLGATFFCSRQFEETRSLQRIVPTIAFQLSRKCGAYRSALYAIDSSGAVQSHSVQEQIRKFFFQPWKEQKHFDGKPTYLIVVDALDEIEEMERSSFLEQLLKSVKKENIAGLKFLVTSRPDPDIVRLCKSFPPGAFCRLQDVPIKDAMQDIKTYLGVKLENLEGTTEFSQLNERSAGLFIYASTVVKILTKRKLERDEQLSLLRRLLSSTSSSLSSIDQLYQQIMCDAFADLDDDLLSIRLSILHTFLCTPERISVSVAARLQFDSTDGIARRVLDSLHAVLYEDNGRVYWYHASFPDFIFDPARSNFRMDGKEFHFSCDTAAQHSLLMHACFRIMNSKDTGLRFNMGDIQSSYLLDSEHAEELRENVNKNISPALRYACMHWAHHVSLSPTSKADSIYDVITDFLQLRVLFWIEAMHLLGSSGECSHLLNKGRNWASKDGNPSLAKDLLAVADFASYFTSCPAANSTPHLYISSLATWQSASHLSQSWKDAFPGIPVYEHTGGIIAMPIMTIKLNNDVGVITLSPDSKYIVAGFQGCAMVLDASTGREEYLLRLEDSPFTRVTQVEFSPDGTRFAMVSRHHNDYYTVVRIWDVSTFQYLYEFEAYRAAVSMEGTEILIISDADSHGYCQFLVLDISTGTLLRKRDVMMATPEGRSPLLIGFSYISMRCILVHKESVEIWDISPEYAPKIVTLNDCAVNTSHGEEHGAISPDGKLIAMVNSRNSFEAGVFDASTGYRLFVLPHDQKIGALNFSYDGTRIVSVTDAGIHVWEATTGMKLKVVQTNSSIFRPPSVAFTRDGSHIGLRIEDTIHVWSIGDLPEVGCDTQNVSLSDAILTHLRHVGISDKSKKIMSFNHIKVQVWDGTTEASPMAMSVLLQGISDARMSGNGENIICCLKDSVMVLNATNGNEVLHLNSEINTKILSIAISRSGKKIALAKKTTSGVRCVEIWGLNTGREAEFNFQVDNSGYSYFLDFLDDERYIVAAFDDYPIVICDVQTGNTQKIQCKIKRNSAMKLSVYRNQLAVFEHPPSLSIISCRVWDILSGELQRTLQLSSWPHRNHGVEADPVFILSFAFSSNKFVATSFDGYIRVWASFSKESVIDVMLVYCSPSLNYIALSRDDGLPVTGSKDGSIQVWDLDDLDKADKYPWTLTKNGWIISSENPRHRRMWVSDGLNVRHPRSISFISGPGYGTVDFFGAKFGEEWEQCYSPQNHIGNSK